MGHSIGTRRMHRVGGRGPNILVGRGQPQPNIHMVTEGLLFIGAEATA